MKILYLTPKLQPPIVGNGIYADLICTLKDRGHLIDIACAHSQKTAKEVINGINILKISVGNQYNVGLIKKGLVFLSMKGKWKRAIKKHLSKNSYDLLLYEAPPVMFAEVVKYCKKLYGCKTYLMQKDIFPQNALDLGILKKSGIKGIIYRYFKKKERRLYEYSDMIGCMSQANLEFLKTQNGIDEKKLEIFPNAVIPLPYSPPSSQVRAQTLGLYGIDAKKTVFVFGGNLGKPQGVDFLISAAALLQDYEKAFFVFVGRGTEKERVKRAAQQLNNSMFIEELPPSEYFVLASCCDVGIISLDYRFTIPNYPSRILNYMQSQMPVIAATDTNTDCPQLITKQADCGLWCASNDAVQFAENVKTLCEDESLRLAMGKNGRAYLETHFNCEICAAKLEKFME